MSLDFVVNKDWEALSRFWFKIIWPFHKKVSYQEVTQLINHFGLTSSQILLKNKLLCHDTKRMLLAFAEDEGLAVNTTKRIAVCLSGDIRSFSRCQPTIRRFFKGHNVTYFFHCWNDSNTSPLLLNKDRYFIKRQKRPDLTALEKKSIEKFGLKTYSPDKKIPYMSTNLFPMWYGVRQAFLMIAENGFDLNDFDLIARCRYDNYFLGQLEQYQQVWRPNKIVIDSNYNGYGGYGDQFAIGKPLIMQTYCQLFDWFNTAFETLNDKSRFFAEVVLKEYLNTCKIDVDQVNFGLRLMRKEFMELPRDKIPLRSHITSNARNQKISDYIQEKFPELFNQY